MDTEFQIDSSPDQPMPGAKETADGAPASDNAEALKVDPARAALVKRIIGQIKAAKAHWKATFDKMDSHIKLVADIDAAQQNGNKEAYVANLLQRHVQEKTSMLYAKNPRCRAKRKQRMDFKVWDGTMEQLQSAFSVFQQSIPIADPVQKQQMLAPVQDLIDDIKQGKQARDMLSRVGKTLEILFHYYLDESEPRFKTQAKQLIRRVVIAGIGWIKLSYQRQLGRAPDVIDQINDITERLATIDRLTEEMQEGEIEADSADAEQLRQVLAGLQAQPDVLIEEGLVFTFPRAQRVILDPATTQISGFIGTSWLAEEFLKHPGYVQEVYGVDLEKNFTPYQPDMNLKDGATPAASEKNTPAKALACFWQFHDKKTGLVYTVCDGYPDFLEEPKAPSVKIKRFFPYFSLMFNEVENNDESIYPQSDVELIWPAQREYNRMREALRQHRIASAPFYVTSAANLEEEDENRLKARAPHEVLKIKGIPPGTDVEKVLQAMKTVPVDPNMYEVNTTFTDIQRTTGSQQADFGGTPNKGTATGASIAEGSRASTVASNTDDLDEMLTDLAKAAGEVMMMELDTSTVQKIAGPGAVWATLARQDMADSVYLEIIAGSSGVPNKAQDLANFERVSPFLLQAPGINPAWIARTAVGFVDESVDLEEALLDGIPSVIAQNAMASRPPGAPPGPGGGPQPGPQPDTGNPATSPAHQGPVSAHPTPAPPMPLARQPGPQPAFPPPAIAPPSAMPHPA